MKKFMKILIVILTLCLAVTGLTACGGEKEILVVSREAGSGTRDAFDSLIKNDNGDSLAKKADGTTQPSSVFVSSLNIQDGTAKILTKVGSSKNAIGYISLGSVDDSVKAVSVNGVAPTSETVLDGTYSLARPFVIMTKKGQQLTAATEDFLKYLNSSTAQAIVSQEKYVKQESGKTDSYTAPAETLSGTVKLRGSTSVEPLMQKLIADYLAKGGARVSGVSFDLDAAGSSAGISDTKNDTTGNIIGMSSSAIKSKDAGALDYFSIALDAVAVIVHKDNPLTNLTISQIFGIYTGSIKTFSEISA